MSFAFYLPLFEDCKFLVYEDVFEWSVPRWRADAFIFIEERRIPNESMIGRLRKTQEPELDWEVSDWLVCDCPAPVYSNRI
jgi:GH43 family beta-xylosidase